MSSWWRGVAVDVGPLRRHRDYSVLFAAQSVTAVGSTITRVAVPFQVYRLTHSSFAVGALGLVQFLAVISMAFVGGAIADAFDRRRILVLTEVGQLCVSLALLTNAVWAQQLALLYVLAGASACLSSVQRPSTEALLPRLVPVEDLAAASGLNGIRWTASMIAGPAIGGVLISTAGLASTYAVDVASFIASLALLSRLPAVPAAVDAPKVSARGILDGLAYARSRPELLGTYLVDINAMFFGMPDALFPALAAHHGGPRVLGLYFTAPAVGSFLASVSSGWTARVHRHGVAVLWAAGLWGVAIIGFGLSGPLWLSLGFLACAGAADMVSGLFRMVIWNTTIPDHLRGRLAGIEMVSYMSGPTLGNVEAGAVASVTGPRLSVGIGGVLCVIGTAALGIALPSFRRYDARRTSDPQDRTSGPAP